MKIHNIKYILFFFLLSNGLFAQNHYAPTEAVTTGLSKSQHIHVLGYSSTDFSFSKSNHDYNVQLGYSPIQWVGVNVGYYSSVASTPGEFLKTRDLNGWNAAVGGYYLLKRGSLISRRYRNQYPSDLHFKIKESQLETGLLMSAYIGYGKGEATNNYGVELDSRFTFEKGYGQISFSWLDRFGGIAYYFRFGKLQFNTIAAQLVGTTGNRLRDSFENILDDNPYPIREHTFQFFIGTKNGRIIFSFNQIASDDNYFNFGATNKNFKLGFLMNVDEFF